MRLTSRVQRLERRVMPSEPGCATCGAPWTMVAQVILIERDDVLRTCSDCGRYLNDSGRPLAVPLLRITLEEPPPVTDADGCPGCGRVQRLVICFRDESAHGNAKSNGAASRSDGLTGEQIAARYAIWRGGPDDDPEE